MVRQSIFADTCAVVGVVSSSAAGVRYGGIWGGVAALSAALLAFSMIHWIAMIRAAVQGAANDALKRSATDG
jgi:hypothetical protein